ncbi:type I polyketide synthase, partial [Winogradskya humida]
MNSRSGSLSRSGDVAITGLALRFPGSDTLPELFGHLVAGRSLITEVPAERWAKERHFGDPRSGEARTNSIWAGFIEGADRFDAAFFNISPREAETMDPQQRFALELAWHAIEDAGYRAGELAGSRTGVYMGLCHADYAELMERDGVPTDAYFPTGTAYSIVANRLSYFFDLRGPSITNDTACSSSLVSIYEAVAALTNGDCDLALAGGVNLAWSPKLFVAFSQAGMLSPTGRSHAFDQNADGFVRGEGGAVLLLKPLEAALADGDAIHAVIRGAGTNHGGRTSSLTVTNPRAQAALIENVYSRAGVAPETVTYIEAHGPGTPVGDPIEILGLKNAFRSMHDAAGTRPEPQITGIGSIKSNIGHLESAAGVAGVVKVIGAMATGTLPGTVNFRALNQLIDLDGSPFRIVGETQPWTPPADLPRRAGVSSFGFGGTNAHVLLEEPPVSSEGVQLPGPYLVPLSAKNPARLREAAARLRAYLQGPADDGIAALRAVGSMTEIAYTLQVGREAMAARAAFVVNDHAELVAALEAFTPGEVHAVEQASEEIVATAARWVGGESVDWAASYETRPHRVRLPGYPFAADRHWFVTPPAAPPAVDRLHPLVHRNTSTLNELRFSSTFDGSEPFLDAHRVEGRAVLPAVAHLEMARAAVGFATGQSSVSLSDVAWLRPLIGDVSPIEVDVALRGQDDGIAFEIKRGEVVYSAGFARTGSLGTPPRVDLDAVRAACTDSADVARLYEELRGTGLSHGPAMRRLRAVSVGQDQALARIDSDDVDGYVLAPSVVDAAFQVSLLLLGDSGDPVLAFAVRELQAYAACTSTTWAWVRRTADGTFDIDLCDGDGTVLAAVRGLAQRTARASSRVVTATSQWIDTPVRAGSGGRTVHGLVVGRALDGCVPLPAISAGGVAPGVQQTLMDVFSRVQDVLRSSPDAEQRFVVLVDGRVPEHHHAPLSGFLRSVVLENPLVSGRVVRVAGLSAAEPASLNAILGAEGSDESADTEVRYLGDARRQSRQTVELPSGPAPRVPALRTGGVYWILGGAGGIGAHVARYLARAQDSVVVLSGRSADSSAVAALRRDGIAAHYLPVDVTDGDAVRRAVSSIEREHGGLHGVVNAAGVLRDQFLLRKELTDVRTVTAPKIDGTLHLDVATRHLDLDFFVLFSSVAAEYGNAGQTDYSAANAFLDAFAGHRQALVDAGERTGRSVAISWPLWEQGGMTLDDATRAELRADRGWEALPTEDGVRALGRALLTDAPSRMVVAYGAAATLSPQRWRTPPALPATPAPAAAAVPSD